MCSGKDALAASAYLCFSNGVAYGAKGELKQSIAFETKAAQEFFRLKEFAFWANSNL
jgi:hypothetical protein